MLGPKDMQKAGKTIGQWLNKLVRSDGWKVFQQTSREIRNLPTQMMKEANLDLKQTEEDIRNSINPKPQRTRTPVPASSPTLNSPPAPKTESAPEPGPANPPSDEEPHA